MSPAKPSTMTTAYEHRFRRLWLIGWVLFGVGMVAFLAGEALSTWPRVVWFDDLLHTYNSFAVALLVAIHLDRRLFIDTADHGPLQVVLVVCATLALGVLWELAEWGYDVVRSGNLIGGKTDTLYDLVCDSVGGFFGALIGLRALRASRPRAAGASTPSHHHGLSST